VGSLGGRDRMEYGIIGDTVNIASRLESCVKERQPDLCRILIAEETYRVMGDAFPVEGWGEMALKGKRQLVGTYRVLR
jgi:adenylate cyclase